MARESSIEAHHIAAQRPLAEQLAFALTLRRSPHALPDREVVPSIAVRAAGPPSSDMIATRIRVAPHLAITTRGATTALAPHSDRVARALRVEVILVAAARVVTARVVAIEVETPWVDKILSLVGQRIKLFRDEKVNGSIVGYCRYGW